MAREQFGAYAAISEDEFADDVRRRWMIVVVGRVCVQYAHTCGYFPDPHSVQVMFTPRPNPCDPECEDCEHVRKLGVKLWADKGDPLPDDFARVGEALLAQDAGRLASAAARVA